MTEDFYVATKLATTESSTAHDRAGSAKAGVHDSVALCCVAIEEAMWTRHTGSGTHDRPWACTKEVCVRHGNSITTERTLSRQRAKARKNFMSRHEFYLSLQRDV